MSQTSTRRDQLVLIIDEDETTRDLYGRWFAGQGFQVMCAVGIEGLWLALRRDRPQLIVTELRARDLTVSHLLARLKCDETTRCIPVLVVTANGDERAHAEAKALGAAGVLPKFLDFERLRNWVRALCSWNPRVDAQRDIASGSSFPE